MTPLIVRLPNHLGDACMSIAALDALAAGGHALTLAGRPWIGALFEAYPWRTVPLGGRRLDRVRALRDAAKGSDGVLFTNSFSTALEFRLAGIAATGYARGGRSWLLSKSVRVNDDDHMVEYYLRLASTLLPRPMPVPAELDLRVSAAARQRVRVALSAAGARSPYVVLCPVAVGLHHGKVKAWDGFTRLHAELVARGHCVVALPGPGESAEARRVLPEATLLPESDVGTFAALLADARLVVANDSGAGHLAAAVGAPLVSVFGVTEPERTRPWGPHVRMVGSGAGWPSYEDVAAAVDEVLTT
jgi:lipopolysaccharide heptosyltransferase II